MSKSSRHNRPSTSTADDDSADWVEWHPLKMRCDQTLLAVAPRGQGKTTLLLDVARKGQSRCVMVVCPTPELYKTYAEHIPIIYCHGQYDERLEEQIDNILEYHNVKSLEIHVEWKHIVTDLQEEAKLMQLEWWRSRMTELADKSDRHGWSREKIKRKVKQAEEKHRIQVEAFVQEREKEYLVILEQMRTEYSWTCIWDDLAYDKNAMNSTSIAKSVKNGRHYIQKQMYACQAVRDFKCSNRDQIDILAMSPLVTTSNLRRFMDDFIPSGFTKPAEFLAVLRIFAKNKWWLVIDRRTSSLDPKDFIFRYRATHSMLSPGYIGCPGYRLLNTLIFDPVKMRRTIARDRSAMDKCQALKDSDPNESSNTSKTSRGRKGASDDASNDDTRGKVMHRKPKSTDMGLFETVGPQSEMEAIQAGEQRRRDRVSKGQRAAASGSESDSSDDENGGDRQPSRHQHHRQDRRRVEMHAHSLPPLATSIVTIH